MKRCPRARFVGILAVVLVSRAASAATAPNFLVVVLDDVGVDKIAAYGRAVDPGRTPNIDALARRGVLFDNAWASPTCTPSRASALTGRRPELTRIGAGLRGHPGLDSDELTVAKVLKQEGYATAAIGKWHLGKHPTKPFDLGFDTHRGMRNNIRDYRKWRKFIDGVEHGWQTTYATTDTADDAIDWLEEQQGPWFLWLAFQAAHGPLHAPPTRLHSYGVLLDSEPPVLFKAMVEALDKELGRVLAVAGPETTVVLFSDNGTYATAIEPPFDPRHGKGTAFEVGVNVPLIIAGPLVAPRNRGTRSDALVHVSDIFATIVELSGGHGAAEDSVSFAPQFQDATAPGRSWAYTSGFKPNGGPPDPAKYRRAARDPRYKLIRHGKGVEFLFDLEDDPYEQTNLLGRPLDPGAERARERLSRVIDSKQWGGSSVAPKRRSTQALFVVVTLSAAVGFLALLRFRLSKRAAS